MDFIIGQLQNQFLMGFLQPTPQISRTHLLSLLVIQIVQETDTVMITPDKIHVILGYDRIMFGFY
jgi:hypothetical protein